MLSISAGLQTRINLGSLTLCRLWSVAKRDGVTLYFTDLDAPVTFGGHTYLPTSSFKITNLTSTLAGGSQSADMVIIFGTNAATEITYDDAIRGYLDNAHVIVSFIDYKSVADGVGVLLDGYTGAFEIGDKNTGSCEIVGRLQRALNKFGEFYTPECRASLGDSRCKVNLAGFTTTGVVTTITNNRKFRVDLADNQVNFYYSLGTLTWTSGLNNGQKVEVLSQYAIDATIDELIMALSFPRNVTIGDTFSLIAGCDKRPVTCRVKFNNIVNMRAEPFVPNADKLREPPRVELPVTPSGTPSEPSNPDDQPAGDPWGILQSHGGYL